MKQSAHSSIYVLERINNGHSETGFFQIIDDDKELTWNEVRELYQNKWVGMSLIGEDKGINMYQDNKFKVLIVGDDRDEVLLNVFKLNVRLYVVEHTGDYNFVGGLFL